MPRTRTITALFFSLFLLHALPSVQGQAIVEDPFPKKIEKGSIKVGLKDVAGGMTAPVWGTHAGDDRLFIVDQAGVVRILKEGKLLEKPFLDVAKLLVKLQEGFDERGLLGLAFHPGFSDKNSPGYGRLYTYTSEPAGENDFPLAGDVKPDSMSVLAEWRVSTSDPESVDPATRRVVLTFAQPQFNHNGGAILFDKQGLLYIGTGDGGLGNDLGPGHASEGNGQNLKTPLGKVLCIDPLGGIGTKKTHGRYSVPNDNPLIGKEGLAEIYAWGMRNPWRLCFDRVTGQLIAADVGQAKIEEIDVIQRGGNYGWPIKEGAFFFIREGDKLGQVARETSRTDLPKFIEPVAQYDHDEGISITGGFVYRGKAVPSLQGKYVFGDWNAPQNPGNGRLFYADLATGQINLLPFSGDDRPFPGFILGFGEDRDGEIYILTSRTTGPKGDTGKAMKIVPAE